MRKEKKEQSLGICLLKGTLELELLDDRMHQRLSGAMVRVSDSAIIQLSWRLA